MPLLALAAFAVALLHAPADVPELRGRPLHWPCEPASIAARDLPDLLTRAHLYVFDRKLSRSRLRIMAAQLEAEGLSLCGKNLGGLEYVAGKPWVRLDRLTRLRAFDTYFDAAVAYLSLLGRICKGALMAMDNGDPDDVAEHLKRCGYFGVPTEQYAAMLRALMR